MPVRLFFIAVGWLGMAQISLSCYSPSNSMLPDSRVLSLAWESGDTVWVGTSNGLRPYRVSTLDFGNWLAPAAWIARCVPSPGNEVWCAFYGITNPPDGGAIHWDGTTLTYHRKADMAPSWSRPILERAIAREGSPIWLGTFGAGLFKYDGTSWIHYHPRLTPGMPDSFIHAIAIDAQGRKWLATDQGVVRWDGTTWTNLGLWGPIQTVYIDPTGTVWAAQSGSAGRVYRYNPATNSWIQVLDYPTYDFAYSGGELWVATQDTGVIRYNPTTGAVTYFINRATSNLPPGSVRAIATDDQGRVFIGMLTSGFCVYAPTTSLLSGRRPFGQVFPNPASEHVFLPFLGRPPEHVGLVKVLDL